MYCYIFYYSFYYNIQCIVILFYYSFYYNIQCIVMYHCNVLLFHHFYITFLYVPMYLHSRVAALMQSKERPTDSANAIVEGVLTDYRTEHDHILPKIVNEARGRRIGDRLLEPTYIEFLVCIYLLYHTLR